MSIYSRPSRLQCGTQLTLAFMEKNNEGGKEHGSMRQRVYNFYMIIRKVYVYNYIFIDMVMTLIITYIL